MNPQISPYGQPQGPPQAGWPNNMNQQMSNMNLGPPKPGAPQQPQQNFPPQQQQQPGGFSPQPQQFNNFPPTNGVHNGLPPFAAPQGLVTPNRMPPSQFPPQPIQQTQPTSAAPGFPPLQQPQMTPNQSFGPPPTSMGNMAQSPMAPGQRPQIPGQNSFGEQNLNGLNGQPPRELTPQPQQQQVSLGKPPGMGMGQPPAMFPPQQQQPQGMAPTSQPQPGMPPQNIQGAPPGMGSINQQPPAQGMPPQNIQKGPPGMPQQGPPTSQNNPLQPPSGMSAPISSPQQFPGAPQPQMQSPYSANSQQFPPPGVNQMQSPNPMMRPNPGMPPMPGQQPFMQTPGAPMSNPMAQPQMFQSQPQNRNNYPQGSPMYPQQGQQPPGMMPGQQPPGMMPGQQPPGMMPGQQPPGLMPGQQYPPGGQPPFQNSPMGGVPPARRLDPDQMPNPIQVMSENQRAAGGVFTTNQVGLVPPLVTTKYITQDQGNSGPRFMRSSMYSVPATTDMMKTSAVPFAIVLSPFARVLEQELQPPIVDFGEIGPIRCIRCKAYMSPHMQFIDAGRRFQCLLCKATTEIPAEYFQHLDHTGQRVDKYERPELVLGTYEFIATKDYCRNNVPPKSPAMIFVLDVSYNNVKSGLVHLMCAEMKRIIQNLPIDQGCTKSTMKVGFITYNNTVHFYNVKANLAQPQMMVVGDVHEMFMPLLDGFLCDPEESGPVIEALMDQIPKMFGETRETETILLPAIQAGLEALKASECAGKLLVFHSSLPIADAPGKLKNRDDRKLLGTEKEKTVLTPQVTTYNNLGQECVAAGCCVDLFVFNNAYIDLATIGQVSRLTGGEIFKYTYFQADIDGERLVNDIIKNISRPIAFDTVMRVRTSTGIRPTDFYGHFFMSNTTDMEIAAMDCDKSIAIEIKHDDKLSPDENVYIQVALLYTSVGGQRRLRVLNLSLKTCTQLADLFRSCDLDTIILFFAKQGIFKLLEHTPKIFKENLINRAAQILACYRKNCASPTSAGQLILPECLKLLPLYVSCLLKNDAFSGGSDITLDDRSYVMYFVSTMDLPTSVTYFYPRLIPVHSVDVEETDVPPPMRCTIDKMADDGAYILDNGIYMFLWLGVGLSSEFTQAVFGAQSTQVIDTDRSGLPVFDNAMSKRVRGIVDSIQNDRHRCMRIALVRQRDKLESVLRHFMIEDRGTNGTDSYVDFLCHMHKEIRALLS